MYSRIVLNISYYGDREVADMYNIIMCDEDAGYIKELVALIHKSNDGKRELNIQKYTSGEEFIKCIAISVY